jgi:DNA-binding GntR family transcriptional regulator
MKPDSQRNPVRSFIMNELMSGALQTGDRLSLPFFAEKLNCSVTPIREALTQLAYVNIVEAIPNRGFIIPPLSAKEAQYLYELIAGLEGLALENSNYTPSDIKELKQLNKKFDETEGSLKRIRADFDFHDKLTRHYKNPLLHQHIHDIKVRIFSYEKEFMSISSMVIDSGNQHRKIIDAVEKGNTTQASRLLKQNWHIMLNFIQKQLS